MRKDHNRPDGDGEVVNPVGKEGTDAVIDGAVDAVVEVLDALTPEQRLAQAAGEYVAGVREDVTRNPNLVDWPSLEFSKLIGEDTLKRLAEIAKNMKENKGGIRLEGEGAEELYALIQHQTSLNRLAESVSNVLVMVYSLDSYGTLTHWSPAATRLTGKTHERVVEIMHDTLKRTLSSRPELQAKYGSIEAARNAIDQAYNMGGLGASGLAQVKDQIWDKLGLRNPNTQWTQFCNNIQRTILFGNIFGIEDTDSLIDTASDVRPSVSSAIMKPQGSAPQKIIIGRSGNTHTVIPALTPSQWKTLSDSTAQNGRSPEGAQLQDRMDNNPTNARDLIAGGICNDYKTKGVISISANETEHVAEYLKGIAEKLVGAREFLRNSPFGFLVTDMSGSPIYANPALAGVLGAESQFDLRTHLKAEHWKRYIHVASQPVVQNMVNAALTGGKESSGFQLIDLADGRGKAWAYVISHGVLEQMPNGYIMILAPHQN